jgi:ABC-type sugar transport system substrate-binding protein
VYGSKGAASGQITRRTYKSRKLISDFLNRHPKDKYILIAAATDTSALGALDAVRELKREAHVAIVGQDCIPEALEEIRSERSALIGSVSHETGSYGPSLIHLGLALLRGQTVPPYNYVAHKMITLRRARLEGGAEGVGYPSPLSCAKIGKQRT